MSPTCTRVIDRRRRRHGPLVAALGVVVALTATGTTGCAPGSETASPATTAPPPPTDTTGTATQRLRLPAPSAVDTVATLPRFGEGVVFDGEGRLFVSDPAANQILLVDEDGTTNRWAGVDTPNGHKVLADGTHVVLEQGGAGRGAITQLAADGTVMRRITVDDRGLPFRWPNDIGLDPTNGGFYVTDPGPFQGGEPGRIFYIDAQWRVTTVSDAAVDFPNGVVVRPDGRTVLVAESLQNRVLGFTVDRPGSPVGQPEPFAVLPSFPNAWTGGQAEPDGMALDEAGNLFVAHFGAGQVHVLNADGQLLGSYGSGSNTVTNLAFGGPERNQLYIYAAQGNSIAEFDRGGYIARLTLPGITGLDLTP